MKIHVTSLRNSHLVVSRHSKTHHAIIVTWSAAILLELQIPRVSVTLTLNANSNTLNVILNSRRYSPINETAYKTFTSLTRANCLQVYIVPSLTISSPFLSYIIMDYRNVCRVLDMLWLSIDTLIRIIDLVYCFRVIRLVYHVEIHST